MAIYTLTPNERDIHLYLTPENIQEFDRTHPDYKAEPLTIELDWAPFENKAEFEREFKDLLDKYGLIAHYDNLLYIVLTTFDDQWTKIQHAYDDYDSKKRARELAQLLLLLNDTPTGKLNTVAFKTLTADAKVSDTVLTDWISKTLTNAITKKQYPIGQFGDAVHAILGGQGPINKASDIDYDLLKKVVKKRLINPKNSIRRGQAEICFIVYGYLQTATEITSAEGAEYSETQLEFLFKLLKVLKQIDADALKSDDIDYMRSFLMNTLNR